MRGDRAIEGRMIAYLDPGVEDGVRAIAAHGAIDARNFDAMPVAFELVSSPVKSARMHAVLAIVRSNSRPDLEKLGKMDWSADPEIWAVISTEMKSKGIPIPIAKKL